MQARLLARLRNEGLDLPEGARLERVYASRSGRTEGAWSWHAVSAGGLPLNIGSQWPMAACLKAARLQAGEPLRHGDVHIDPVGAE